MKAIDTDTFCNAAIVCGEAACLTFMEMLAEFGLQPILSRFDDGFCNIRLQHIQWDEGEEWIERLQENFFVLSMFPEDDMSHGYYFDRCGKSLGDWDSDWNEAGRLIPHETILF